MGRDRGRPGDHQTVGAGTVRGTDPLVPLRDAIGQLVGYYNALHWGGTLPGVVVHFGTQAPNGRRLGHYSPGRWTDGTNELDELAIYADLCLARGWEEVALTVLHELVHLWEVRVADVEPRADYHTGRWHREARRVGLATRGPRGATTATDVFREQLDAAGIDSSVIPWRLRDAPKPSKLKRLSCGCTIIRAAAGVEVEAVCLRCGLRFAESPPSGELTPDGDGLVPELVTCPRCEQLTPVEVFDARRNMCASCDHEVRHVGLIVAHARRALVRDRVACELRGVGTWRVALQDEPPPF